MWYHKVSKDINNLPKALDYFEKELINAKKDCELIGSLERSTTMLPGIVEQRFSQYQELDAILELLKIQFNKIKGKHIQNYHLTNNKAYAATTIDKILLSEDDVTDFLVMINEVTLLKNKWAGISKALETKQWQITNLIKWKSLGLDDIML